MPDYCGIFNTFEVCSLRIYVRKYICTFQIFWKCGTMSDLQRMQNFLRTPYHRRSSTAYRTPPFLLLCLLGRLCIRLFPTREELSAIPYGTRNMWFHIPILGNMFNRIICQRRIWTLCEICILPRYIFRQSAYSRGSHSDRTHIDRKSVV